MTETEKNSIIHLTVSNGSRANEEIAYAATSTSRIYPKFSVTQLPRSEEGTMFTTARGDTAYASREFTVYEIRQPQQEREAFGHFSEQRVSYRKWKQDALLPTNNTP